VKVITPLGVRHFMGHLEPGTSEFKQQASSIRAELDEALILDPIGIGSLTWTAMLSRLQLDIYEKASRGS
jgi:hypothetical protein